MHSPPRATVVKLATRTFLSAISYHSATADQHERRGLILKCVERPRKNLSVVAVTRMSEWFFIRFVNVALRYGQADIR